MQTFETILSRRSVRLYSSRPIEKEIQDKIVQSAIWAPSGKNCQPWKFKIIIEKNIIEEISNLSIGTKWLKTAPCLIIVYLDKAISYHYVKDILSCGAAIQNMLLTAHELRIGSCWVGDLLDKADAINKYIQIDDHLELMGVISLGYGRGLPINTTRKETTQFLI